MQDYNRLSEHMFKRRRFNPGDKKDLKELAYFQKNKTWKSSCPFLLEWPFKDIVTMCNTRYTEHMLKTLAK